jgi:hypothetical protein
LRDQYLEFVATMTPAMTAVTAVMHNGVDCAVKVLFTGTSLGVEDEGMSILKRTDISRKTLMAKFCPRSDCRRHPDE